jgi:hypothetical protein
LGPARSPVARLLVAAAAAGALAVALGTPAVVESVRPGGPASSPEISLAGARQAIAVLSKPGVERIPLARSAGAVELAVAPLGRSVLLLDGLEPAPAGSAYRAWRSTGTGADPLATFSGREPAVALRGLLPPGAAVFVTLEREGGGDAPAGPPLFAGGRSG